MSNRMNPLFVDSTKLYGESITSQIELEGVILKPGESVVARIQKRSGEAELINLRPSDKGRFEGRTWLGHQEIITLQFLIQGEQGVRQESQPLEITATYVISEKWQSQVQAPEPVQAEPKKKMSLWKESLVFDWVNDT